MAKSNSPWRNPWVLGMIGMLAVFVSANFYMIFVSASGGPGLVVDNYYERGENYEKTMLKRMTQDPGWKAKLQSPESIEVGKKQIINVIVTDKETKPVNKDSAVFNAYRPSDKSQDFSLPMRRIDDGLYEVEVSFPLPGVWDLLVTLAHEDIEVNLPQRISVGKR